MAAEAKRVERNPQASEVPVDSRHPRWGNARNERNRRRASVEAKTRPGGRRLDARPKHWRNSALFVITN